MKKLAIIGASYLQNPLILKAKDMGLETHVFAWAAGDIGEKTADYFYPISIVEKETILEKCREIGIDGICTIASDLAVITSNYVANGLGLVANSLECTEKSTNKHLMRRCFEEHKDPSPKSVLISDIKDLRKYSFDYPIIVKPIDRSGSRGITKLSGPEKLADAVSYAIEQGFSDSVLVEEFAEGDEYSVECISWNGEHSFITITKKYTTGSPSFIEKGHLEPALVNEEQKEKIKKVVIHALDSLGIQYGASHSEIKISNDGDIKIIEIGGRMGGDNIGASLVKLSTGYDFLKAVIDIALGNPPEKVNIANEGYVGIRFIFDKMDIETYNEILKINPDIIVEADIKEITSNNVTDSSSRFGYYILKTRELEEIEKYLPKED